MSHADDLHDAMLATFDRAFRHVPLSLYDEDLKPAERALGNLIGERDCYREVLRNTFQLAAVANVDAILAQARELLESGGDPE